MKWLSKKYNQIFIITMIETFIFYKIGKQYSIEIIHMLIMFIPLYVLYSIALDGYKN